MDVSQRGESSQISTDSLSLSQGTAEVVGHAAVGSGGAPTAGHTATSAQAMSVAPSATGIPVATDGAGGPNATNTVTRPEPVIPYQRRQEKTKWLPEEDEALKKAVALHDAKNWKGISSYLEEKSWKQCRERWLNHLNPDINKTPWTFEEDQKILDAHRSMVSLSLEELRSYGVI